jgi:hypothetical protein
MSQQGALFFGQRDEGSDSRPGYILQAYAMSTTANDPHSMLKVIVHRVAASADNQSVLEGLLQCHSNGYVLHGYPTSGSLMRTLLHQIEFVLV